MKKRFIAFLLCLVMIAALVSTASAADMKTAGKVISYSGYAYLQRGGEDGIQLKLYNNAAIMDGDLLIAPLNAFAMFYLCNNTMISLEPGSAATVMFIDDSVLVELHDGSLTVMTLRSTGTPVYAFLDGNIVSGNAGSIYYMAKENVNSAIAAGRGTVMVTNFFGEDDAEFNLPPGYFIAGNSTTGWSDPEISTGTLLTAINRSVRFLDNYIKNMNEIAVTVY